MPEFGSPFSGLAKDKKVTKSELVRAIRFMIAAEYEAVQLYMQLAESTDDKLAQEVLKDIADEVSVHETTVSRIANAKYIQTEWGIFPLKYFFTNSISGTGSSGSRFSKEGVKHIIKELIENHKESTRLSDQKIADLLKKQGIQLARRTVAKYRKELDILSSYGR